MYDMKSGCVSTVETLQSNLGLFRDSGPPSPAVRGEASEPLPSSHVYERRVSNMSSCSQLSGGQQLDSDMSVITQREQPLGVARGVQWCYMYCLYEAPPGCGAFTAGVRVCLQ